MASRGVSDLLTFLIEATRPWSDQSVSASDLHMLGSVPLFSALVLCSSSLL